MKPLCSLVGSWGGWKEEVWVSLEGALKVSAETMLSSRCAIGRGTLHNDLKKSLRWMQNHTHNVIHTCCLQSQRKGKGNVTRWKFTSAIEARRRERGNTLLAHLLVAIEVSLALVAKRGNELTLCKSPNFA